MYWRKKKNKSGVVSIQVIDKSSGKYKLIKTIGSSAVEAEIVKLTQQAQEFINSYGGQQQLDFILGDDGRYFESIYENIQQVQLLGPELVLGKLFDEIGFNAIKEELFRYLVIARLIYPVSKLKTIDYLQIIDEEKFKEDSKWDGLKGYLTNTNLSKETVMDYYRQLWQIEKTFRITKTDLKVRPIYHYKRRRIEAHICISFAACKLYKELERQLKLKKSGLSAERALDILKTIFGITIKLPQSKENKLMLLDKTQEQKNLLALFL